MKVEWTNAEGTTKTIDVADRSIVGLELTRSSDYTDGFGNHYRRADDSSIESPPR